MKVNKLKISVIILMIIALTAFYSCRMSKFNNQASAFHEWVIKLDKNLEKLSKTKSKKINPVVFTAENKSLNKSLSKSFQKKIEIDEITRLMNLLDSSNLQFSPAKTDTTGESWSFSVKNSDQEFHAIISNKDLKKNVPALNYIQLMLN